MYSSIKPSIDVLGDNPQEMYVLYEEKLKIAEKEILKLFHRKEGQVLWWTLYGFSNEKIAQIVDCSVDDVFVYRSKGIRMVRANIRRRYDGYEDI